MNLALRSLIRIFVLRNITYPTLMYLTIGLLAALAAVFIGMFIRTQAAQSSAEALLRARNEELEQARQSAVTQEQHMHKLNEENKLLIAQRMTLEKELQLLRRSTEEQLRMRNEEFDRQLKLVREQLQNAAQDMLRHHTADLARNNNMQLDAIISPLKDSIKDMRTAMESSRDTHNRNTASLEKAIEEVMKRTGEIGREADKLASALRNESKVQGNWGELILDELLAGQGLTEGIHYEKQVTLRDNAGRALRNEESGRRMVPDTILHYPDGKDAIIDSKVSLTAFVDYRNATTDEERTDALTRHLKSLRQHVAELARKDYSSYIQPPRQSLNYVIMFVPNESALQLALYNDGTLWREAFAKNVFITSEQNLMAALRMIQLAWAQRLQAQNQEKIIETGRMLLDRVADFFKSFDDMGQRLSDASEQYRKAYDKLRYGRQSVVGASQKLLKLGVPKSPKKTLPDEEEIIPLPSDNAQE